MAGEQHVIVVVVEGSDSPWDITTDFLTDLRVRGNYDIVATSISPASGIGRRTYHNDDSSGSNTYDNDKCGDNDNYSPCRDNDLPPTFDEILAGLDGHDASVYAGRRG